MTQDVVMIAGHELKGKNFLRNLRKARMSPFVGPGVRVRLARRRSVQELKSRPRGTSERRREEKQGPMGCHWSHSRAILTRWDFRGDQSQTSPHL